MKGELIDKQGQVIIKPLDLVPAFPIDKLKPFPKNPRNHPQAEIDILVKNIKRYGWTNPILIQKSTSYILAGHARLKAAAKLGFKLVPVFVWDVGDEDAMAHLIADNRVGTMSDWDIPWLKDCLAELDGRSYDIIHTGFSDLNVDVLLSHNSGGDFLKKSIDGDNPSDDIEKTPESVQRSSSADLGENVKLVFVMSESDRDFILKGLQAYVELNQLNHAGDALLAIMRERANA